MPEKKNSVVVLLSSYNGSKYIREQIDSILGQKGPFLLDLVLRDDGSSDDTSDIIASYGTLNHFNGENLGSAKSFFTLLLDSGEYDYYAFSDQDDVWREDKIERAISRLSNEKRPALYLSNAEVVDSGLNPVGRNVYKTQPATDLETVSCFGGLLGCSMVFNRRLADIVKRKSIPSKMIMHDFYLAEICLAVGGTILYDDESSLFYRQHDSNVVGVSYGFFSKIQDMIVGSLTREPISIADQAEEIVREYDDMIPLDNKRWLVLVSEYRNNLLTRIKLGLSNKMHYPRISGNFKNRISIILGNK